MNILHTETLFNWGGEQNKTLNEIRFMREMGHNVILFCNPNSQIESIAKEEDFSVIAQEMNKKNFHKSVPVLCEAISSNKIDIVITHGSTDSWVGAIAGLFYRKRGVKFYKERHNLFPIKGFLSKLMHKRLFDKILYISDSVKEYLLSIGVSKDRLVFMPSTVDVEKIDSTKSTFRDEFHIAKDELVIGTFTSLYRKKGVFDFASAAKEILKSKDATIVFSGNISDGTREQIASMFNEKDKIIFTGFRNDAANIIKGFDIYVFASHSEGLGTVLLEAMSSKIPIVVYDNVPMNVLVKDKERGLCAKNLDEISLKECILELINEPEKAKIYSQNAFKFVDENFSHKVLKEAIKNLLEQK
ncbi:glycosyl transferase family 1 [Campylobacter concisus]|uniref:glycosyltransferase family 4 protein n=1 Tax=Campylobacter concisus TaxID=199 RepID=UPI000A1FA93B|nr:glycosyltransferase family 4 protein [Campylobacter concisus]OSQ24283.1 glycosyl transferase family 1 [Campylobacter concisus]